MPGGARGLLIICSGKVNGPTYIKIIEEALSTFIENAFDSSNKQWVFMQDNAPPHRSAYSMKWIKNNHINVIKWSPASHNLNSVENLWDYIDIELQKIKPKNIDELQQMIQDIWRGVTSMHCQRLLNSLSDRIKKCIKFRGGTFNKY